MKFTCAKNADSPLNGAAVINFCAVVVKRRWIAENAKDSELVKAARVRVAREKKKIGRH